MITVEIWDDLLTKVVRISDAEAEYTTTNTPKDEGGT